MECWRGKVALVTGASAGIGWATVKELLTAGMTVVGMARRIDKMQDLAASLPENEQFHPVQGDVSSEEDVTRVFDYIAETFGTMHVLVNNAGVMTLGKVLSSETKDWRKMFDVNVIGLAMCTRNAIKLMRETEVERGHVILINSIAGHGIPDRIDPVMNLYPATKHAVTALNEIIRFELVALKSTIKMTSLSPGYVETEFWATAGLQNPEFLEGRPRLFPEDIASAIITVLSTPPHVNITEMIVKPTGEPSVSPGYVATDFFEAAGSPPEVLELLDGRPKLYAEDIAAAIISVLGTPPHVNITEITVKPTGEPC